MTLKISLTGASATGKTTLGKKLSEELELPFISEVARSVATSMDIPNSDYLADNPRIARDFQLHVMMAQCIKEDYLDGEDFISDRTYLDFLAYWHAYRVKTVSSIYTHRYFISQCRRSITKNDLLIYCPIYWSLPDEDSFRISSESVRKNVDRYIKHNLRRRNIPYVTVTGSTDERVLQVMEKLQIMGKIT